jgi:hypothetical protein
MSTHSLFSHKGWNRLVAVVVAAYIIVIASLVVHERSTINTFDVFDQLKPNYVFWGWSATAFLDKGKRVLKPRTGVIAEVMLLPPLAFVAVVYATPVGL